MGQKPTEEELFQMISEVDENMSGAIGACARVRVSVRGSRRPVPGTSHIMRRRRHICNVHMSWCPRIADFGEFLKVIEKQKERAAKFDDESDMGTSAHEERT